MNMIVTRPQVKVFAAVVSMSFFVIHVAMLVFFTCYGITPMMVFNAFSIVFYLCTLILIDRGKYRAYVASVYVEVVLHMMLASVLVGWDAGFQVTLIGMSILAFFAEYFGRSLSAEHVSGMALSCVGACAYLGTLVVGHVFSAPYALPPDVKFWLQVVWGVMVFAVTITFMQLFVMVTFESERLMSKLIMQDKLTGLPNRYYMSDVLQRMSSEGRQSGHCIAMVDIDNFKQVNDVYGHNCGDYVLAEVARTLREHAADAEVCRWGGEEFLLVVSGEDDANSAFDILDGLRASVEQSEFVYEDQRLHVTVTIGAAAYESGVSLNEWVNLADQNLYEGKTSGKNRVIMS